MYGRVKSWAERLVGASLPAPLWGKLFRLSLRKAHRRGEHFLTFHERPKRTADIGLWSDRRPDLPSVAVVLQGPLAVAGDFTVETVRLYRRTFAGCPLIVSTWEDEHEDEVARLRREGVEVLQSRKPDFPGFKNTNLQLASSLAGIRRAKNLGAEFILKTRTDQRMYAPNIPAFLLGVLSAFPPPPGSRQRGRLVGTSLGSHKYVMYQFSDMAVFGHAGDVDEYFAAPPSLTATLPPDFRDVLAEAARVNAPEHHLATHFLSRSERPIEWSLEDSWRALADHFVIVDRHSLDLIWPKYSLAAEHPGATYAAVRVGHELSFAEWLNLHAGFWNKDALDHHRASQERNFTQDMPPPSGGGGSSNSALGPKAGTLHRMVHRILNRRGPTFVTMHARPMKAAAVGTWPDPLVEAPKVAIVIQGPLGVADDFTLETVRLYRRLFGNYSLILSTWEDESAELIGSARSAGADVVLSRPPADPGPLNVNFQLSSSSAGLHRARELGAEYVLKTRSDQRIYSPNAVEFLVNVLNEFPVKSGSRQRHRIVSCGRSSLKFGLYQVSDQNLFGHVDDLELYFAAPHRPTGYPPDYRDTIGLICRHKAPESYLASHFLQAIGRAVAWTLIDSWDAIAGHFLIVDWSTLDVYWPKYSPHAEHDARYGAIMASQPLDFREWIALWHRRPDLRDLAAYEQALDLPLHGVLPQPSGGR